MADESGRLQVRAARGFFLSLGRVVLHAELGLSFERCSWAGIPASSRLKRRPMPSMSY